MGKPKKYSIDIVNSVIGKKGYGGTIVTVSINHDTSTVVLKDKDHGEYTADLKSLCPKSFFPLHKLRRRDKKLSLLKEKYIGSYVKDCLIKDVFYGPERGYKNRSFYMTYKGNCTHECTDTYAAIIRHKKTFNCQKCSSLTIHGERARKDGVLIKRTPTYSYWANNSKKLPEPYKYSFIEFKKEAGDKPKGRSDLIIDGSKLTWVSLISSEDKELALISTSLRSAFRRSETYATALSKARVETSEGPRYICAKCKGLFKRKDVQVDHIIPVVDIENNPLTKSNIIDRVFTDKVQVLDKRCHVIKTTEENSLRRAHKKSLKEIKNG